MRNEPRLFQIYGAQISNWSIYFDRLYYLVVAMNKAPYTLFNLSLLALILLFTCEARADIYIKIGSGYKFIETDHITRANGEKIYYNTGGKISARIEIGKEHGNWTYGISHHSQWLKGFPVNNEDEPQKTELFIDYKWTL